MIKRLSKKAEKIPGNTGKPPLRLFLLKAGKKEGKNLPNH